LAERKHDEDIQKPGGHVAMTPPSSSATLDLGTSACGPAAVTRLAAKAAFARALAAEFATMGDAKSAQDLEVLAEELDDLRAERRIQRL
jgi:hypothetical protein